MASSFVHILLAALIDTVCSSALAILLVLIGAPVWHLLAVRLNHGRVSASLAITCGLLVLSLFSWHAYRFGLNVGFVYNILIGIGALWMLVASWLLRERALWLKTIVPGSIRAAIAFGVSVLAYGILSHSRIGPAALPLLTVTNNDVLAYLKAADILLHLPATAGLVGPLDMGQWLGRDAFAAFNLLALSAYVLGKGVVDSAMPVLGLGIGLSGLVISEVCRRTFALPWWQALLVTILFTTSQLFAYIWLNYFLSQIVFIGVLLVAFAQIAEAENGIATRASAVAAALIGAVCTMLFYPPWFLPYGAVVSIAGGVVLAKAGQLRLSDIVRAALAAAALFLAINLLAAAASPSRYVIVAGWISSSAAGAAYGWTMPFINPALLLGLPAWWQTPIPGPSFAGQVLPTAAILGLLVFAAWQYDRSELAPGRRFALLCLLAALFFYLVAFLVYGTSYRQWKFATTLAAPFGFIAAAYMLSLCQGIAALPVRRLAVAACCAFLALCIAENVSQYRKRWAVDVVTFAQSMRAVSAVDTDPGVEAVFIDIPGYGEKMAAAVFVRTKPIYFAGPTYYGPGDGIDRVPFARVAVFRRACATQAGASEPSYVLYRVTLDPLPLRSKSELPKELNGCAK